ncbi:MAG: hypothetical protein GY934_04925 [Gammaproteobacteria bacterium]|nr:hypothetical protein [Gammaproteobacteria bacterium]
MTNGASRAISRRSRLDPIPQGTPPVDDPYPLIKARYQSPDGRYHPLLIQQVTTHPITLIKKAVAIYYDRESRRWREISDDQTRIALAQQVEAGTLQVTPDWQSQL